MVSLQNVFSQNNDDTTRFIPKYRPGINYTFKTNVGTVHQGYVVDETINYITVESRKTGEKIELKKNEIVSSRSLSTREGYENDILGNNPHARNYLLTNSAFLFEEGKGTSTSHWFLFENIDYALTDNWAICVNSLAFYPFSIGVKCAFKIAEVDYVGANVFGIANVLSGNTGGSLLWGYGAFGKYTHGSSNRNFTFSGGILGLNSDIFSTVSTSPFVNLLFTSASYCNRFTKKGALNLEGWYFPQTLTLMGGIGFKLLADERNCWSFGCYTFFDNSNNNVRLNLKTVPIPYLGISRKFN